MAIQWLDWANLIIWVLLFEEKSDDSVRSDKSPPSFNRDHKSSIAKEILGDVEKEFSNIIISSIVNW